jgi:hypothetical protein
VFSKHQNCQLSDLPFTDTSPSPTTPPNLLPEPLDRQPSAILPVKLSHNIHMHLHARPPQVLNRDITPPHLSIRLKRDVILRRSLEGIEGEYVKIVWPVAVADWIPVWAYLLEREADGRAWELVDVDLAIGWFEAWR